jgi:hypothetical protein
MEEAIMLMQQEKDAILILREGEVYQGFLAYLDTEHTVEAMSPEDSLYDFDMT